MWKRFKIYCSDTVQNGLYRWHLSSYCNICGSAIEMDRYGIGDIPNAGQQAIIQEYGEWKIFAKDKVSSINYLSK